MSKRRDFFGVLPCQIAKAGRDVVCAVPWCEIKRPRFVVAGDFTVDCACFTTRDVLRTHVSRGSSATPATARRPGFAAAVLPLATDNPSASTRGRWAHEINRATGGASLNRSVIRVRTADVQVSFPVIREYRVPEVIHPVNCDRSNVTTVIDAVTS